MRRTPLAAVWLAACSNENEIARVKTPPEVAILAPAPFDAFRKGVGPLPFVGTATDTFDPLEALTLTWIQDGVIETPATLLPDGTVGLTLDPEPLALGEHLLALRAVDSDGEEGQVGVPWVLEGAISAPSVEITAPDDGSLSLPGEEVTFRGQAVDNNTDPSDLAFAWDSSLDGPLAEPISADGQSVLFTSALSTGTHQITLTVTDIDGEVGIDTLTVSVGAVEEPEPGDLVFSELMINPEVVADELGEWVELYNTAGYAIDVGGYSFHDLDFDLEVLEGPLLVAPGDYVVLCADPVAAENGGVTCDGAFKRKSSGALALGNSGDEVMLSTPKGLVIDQVIYDSSWFAAGIAIGLDPQC